MTTLKEFYAELQSLEKEEDMLSQLGLGKLYAYKEVQELLYNLSKIESNKYSIEDIENCVNTWSYTEVEIEDIERILNQ
jgi:hypothetical protein